MKTLILLLPFGALICILLGFEALMNWAKRDLDKQIEQWNRKHDIRK